MLGPGLRDPLPSAVDGGPLQRVLQHLRQSSRVHNSLRCEDKRRRAVDGPARADSLSGLRRGDGHAVVPFQNDGDADVVGDVDRRVVRHAGGLPHRPAGAWLRRVQVRGQHTGGRGESRAGSGGRRANGCPSCRYRQAVRQQR